MSMNLCVLLMICCHSCSVSSFSQTREWKDKNGKNQQ